MSSGSLSLATVVSQGPMSMSNRCSNVFVEGINKCIEPG